METLSRLVLTFLLNALWQVMLLALVAALGARLLKRSPARYRHLVWVMALGLGFLLPAASALLREGQAVRLPMIVAPSGGTELSSLPALPPAPESEPRLTQATPQAHSRMTESWRWLQGRLKSGRLVHISPPWAWVVLGFYVFSLVMHIGRLLWAWRKTKALRAKADAREIPASLAAVAARCQAEFGLAGRVEILCSPGASSPLVVGARRPIIILPENFFESWAGEELTSALCHEMAHIRRQDFLLNLLYEVFSLPIAFHPANWFIKRRIEQTRELACDELAAGRLVSPSTYARALVSLARAMSNVSPPPRPQYTLGVFDANILEERIMRLLDQRPRASARRARFLLGLAATALTLVSWAACSFAFAAREDAKPRTPAAETGGRTKAVLVKKASDAARGFLGTWRGEFEGKTFIRVTLKEVENKLTGTISIGGFNIDDTGQVVRVNVEPGAQDATPLADVKVDSSLLTFSFRMGIPATGYQFQMKLIGDKKAELKGLVPPPLHGGPVPGWWTVTREPDDPQAATQTPTAVTGGVPGGVSGGVPGGGVEGVKAGGVITGVPSGVQGGVKGATTGSVNTVGVVGTVRQASGSTSISADQDGGRISGTVFDPSGARVPQATVTISNKETGAKEIVETNDPGEFSFEALPPGTYALSVTKVGFGIHAQTIVLPPQKTVLGFDIVLQPGDVLQAIDVTATRTPGAAPAPRKSGPQRIRVGGLVQATTLVESRQPDYPESARAKGIQGVVLLQAVISMEGVPLSLKVISSPDPDLSKSAIEAVKQWRYKPTLLNGDPIEVVTTIAVRFHLGG